MVFSLQQCVVLVATLVSITCIAPLVAHTKTSASRNYSNENIKEEGTVFVNTLDYVKPTSSDKVTFSTKPLAASNWNPELYDAYKMTAIGDDGTGPSSGLSNLLSSFRNSQTNVFANSDALQRFLTTYADFANRGSTFRYNNLGQILDQLLKQLGINLNNLLPGLLGNQGLLTDLLNRLLPGLLGNSGLLSGLLNNLG